MTPIASVAIKARVDTTIVGVHFRDGAHVNKGDLLFTLDCRAMEAQIAQTEGMVARDKAQLAGAERDVARYTDLVAKAATPVINLDNAKTQSEVFRAAIKSDEGLLENLKVQLSFCTITAPISGRISAATVKIGNFVRQADLTPMATINQMAPVYVSFTVPQKNLPDIRQAIAAETATVEAIGAGRAEARQRPGVHDREHGRSRDRHGDDPRHHAQRGRSALAGHAGDRRDDAARSKKRWWCRRAPCRSARPASFVFVVKDGVAKVQKVTAERHGRQRNGDRHPALTAARPW